MRPIEPGLIPQRRYFPRAVTERGFASFRNLYLFIYIVISGSRGRQLAVGRETFHFRRAETGAVFSTRPLIMTARKWRRQTENCCRDFVGENPLSGVYFFRSYARFVVAEYLNPLQYRKTGTAFPICCGKASRLSRVIFTIQFLSCRLYASNYYINLLGLRWLFGVSLMVVVNQYYFW